MKKFLFSTILLLTVYIASAQVDSLQEYTGKYKFAEGSPVTQAVISVQNGLLYVEAEVGGSPMTKISADVFSVDAYDGVATFVRNTDKKVTGVKVEVDGMVMEGTKQDPAKLQECFVFRNEVFSFSRN
ncbi:MAG: DUF3471 domain-containing protein [Chitinophagaceae bacterium]|nr:MAG: DUF3471 domain-containing protein [Chitinophagaceae bacterium]